jgi:hypothetical protein
VDIDTAILMSDLALSLYTAAGVGATIMIRATSLAARAVRGSRVVVWAGFVVAVTSLATITLDASRSPSCSWVATVSVLLLRRSAQAKAVT